MAKDIAKTDDKAVAVKPKEQVRQLLTKMMPEFNKVLPTHLTVEKLMRVAMNAIQDTPKLLECDVMSLGRAVMTSAQFGLEPNTPMGHCYLIPYGERVQFIVGYKGLLALARNSGEIKSISAHVVYEEDEFRYSFGLHEECHHIPTDKSDRGDVTHAYAVAHYKDGGFHFDVMTVAEIENIRNNSQAYKYANNSQYGKPAKQDSIWHLHFDEMCKKTLIRRIAKYLPLSVQKASSINDAADMGGSSYVDRYGEVHVEATELIEAEPTEPVPVEAEDKLDALEASADDAVDIDWERHSMIMDAVKNAPDIDGLEKTIKDAQEHLASITEPMVIAFNEAVAERQQALEDA